MDTLVSARLTRIYESDSSLSDLTVHRLIKQVYFRTKTKAQTSTPSQPIERERIVLDAERDVIGLYKALYMEQFLNEELPAVISGIGKNGLFIHFTTTHDALSPLLSFETIGLM